MDGGVSVNYGYIQSMINSAASTINNNLDIVNNNVRAVDGRVSDVEDEVTRLRAELEAMRQEQRFAAALQRAITEIVRIRQELDQKFGTQQLVRDNMLGILQATDLGLITESTISRCTEELMLSAPKYWLAPCLIALAAWISNNEPLAKRAVAEGYKRDKEKTCLLFALITRRVNAGRIQAHQPTSNATFEWLSRYFSFQDPLKMKRSIIAYIDAYSNGIFGVDRENICSEQIDFWMSELKRRNPSFADEQLAHWKNVFASFCNAGAMGPYAELKEICEKSQYSAMENYLVRINASERDGGIKSYMGNIMEQPVDTEKLINDIDEQLKLLVTGYEEGEETELRNLEEEYQEIKLLKGDEDEAAKRVNARRMVKAKFDEPVDFAKRLADAVFSSTESASAKKAALVMLKPYIAEAYTGFIAANKEAYPNGEIGLEIVNNGIPVKSNVTGSVIAANKQLKWNGTTVDGENREELVASLSSQFDKMKAERVASISDEEANKTKKGGKIACCFFFLAFIPLFIGIKKIKKGNAMLEENRKARVDVANYYDREKKTCIEKLNKALDQRHVANEVVSQFLADEKNEQINI